jgi:hypothetical protein
MARIAGLWVLSVMVVTLTACGSSGGSAASGAEPTPAPAAPAAAPAQAPAAAAAKPAAPPSDRVDDPSFELALVPAPPYTVGKLASFAVSLKPRGVYHINQDYPIDISLTPSEGIALPKAELKKADAASFDEKLARFDVPCTPGKAGPQRVEAKVKFAVCTPENCVPDERTLALVLPVE